MKKPKRTFLSISLPETLNGRLEKQAKKDSIVPNKAETVRKILDNALPK